MNADWSVKKEFFFWLVKRAKLLAHDLVFRLSSTSYH